MGNANGIGHYAYGGATAPGNTWEYVVAMWDGTNTLSMYAENQLVGQNTQVPNGGIYTPNASAPLVIAIRNDLNFAFHGLIQDFALYNYALSLTQISKSLERPIPALTDNPAATRRD